MRNIDKAIQTFKEKYDFSKETILLDDAIEECGLKNPVKKKDEFLSHIVLSGDFIYQDQKLIPRALFLSGVPFRIKIHPYEIENNILISGHRFLPFCHSSIMVDNLSLVYNNKKIKQKQILSTLDTMLVFFNLLDLYRIPVDDLDDYLENRECTFTVYDMTEIYNKHSVKSGDCLIVYPEDITKGKFSIKVESAKKQKENEKEIRAVTAKFRQILSEVIDRSNSYMNTEYQLLLTYYFFSGYNFSIPPEALGTIVSESEDIRFSLMDEGFVKFHHKNDDLNSCSGFKNTDDTLETNRIDLESINGILNMLGSSHSEITVTALILQQLPFKKLKFDAIEKYLFDNSLTMDIYNEVRGDFHELVKELYDECLDDYGTKAPPLLVQSIRSKALGINQQIAQFIRKLDHDEIHPDRLPGKEMSHLIELAKFMDSILFQIEDTSSYTDTDNLESMNRNLDDVGSVVRNLFDNILKKSDSEYEDIHISEDYSEVLQLKITIKGIKPPIWRRVEIPDNYTFFHLHHVIQEAMGWLDYHLHSFEICMKGTTDVIQEIGEPSPEDFTELDDEQLIPVRPLLESQDITVNYLYDFGDYWEHKITLEKVIPRNKTSQYPRCIKGKRACPPEDCGGPPGYEELIEILQDSNHPEYKDTLEWVGDDYDPEYFDIEDPDFSHMY